MAAYISTADVDAFLGEDVRERLFTDRSDSGTYNSTKFTAVVGFASAIVQSAAKNAGYSVGSSTTDDMVKLATLVTFAFMAYGRKQLSPPSFVETTLAGLPEAIRRGIYPLLDTTPADDDAVGANQFSDSTSSVSDGGRPAVMQDLRKYF